MSRALRVGSLCSGYGGLELALELAGVVVELCWWSETGPGPTAVMASHTTAPNLGDLTGLGVVPAVDVVTAGFPCQPVSVAGKQQGVDDDRWLIESVVAVWQRSGARWLVLENVPGLLCANRGEAFGRVLEALASVGASARWTHLRASDIGAPHRRDRWFCVANTPSPRRQRPPGSLLPGRSTGPTRSGERSPNASSIRWERPHGRPAGSAVSGGVSVTDPDGGTLRLEPFPISRRHHQTQSGPHRGPVADTDRFGREQFRCCGVPVRSCRGHIDRCLSARFGTYAPAINQWEHLTGRPAPDPTNHAGRLNARFVEWMQGLPPGWVTDCDELTNGQHLAVLGAGVVPLQAAHALHLLNTES